jgi:hypothetical protein
MTTTIMLICDLHFIQGIPRDFVVSNWRDARGELVDLTGYAAHLTLRTNVGEDALPLLDLKRGPDATDLIGIQVFPLQVLSHFTADQTEAMQPPSGMAKVRGSPTSAPII